MHEVWRSSMPGRSRQQGSGDQLIPLLLPPQPPLEGRSRWCAKPRIPVLRVGPGASGFTSYAWIEPWSSACLGRNRIAQSINLGP